MSRIEPRLATPPRDGYAAYYAEKLWAWVPEIYRTLDAEPPAGGALRALIEIVAAEAAVVRRDLDRLWDDQAIELCDDWAVAYLGALVSARQLSRANPRGARLAAARAIAYQRRKGTLAVMQMAIRDIAGVEGVPVEAFRRLTRFPHRLDIGAIAFGAVTASPSGGLVDLKSPRVSDLTNTAFDEAAHFPDPRRLRGPLGRYGLRKANLHLYPFRAQPIALPTPFQVGPGQFTLDPSGRDVPLFQRGQTSDRPPDAVREVDLPSPIECRRFNATSHAITAEPLAEINDAGLDAALAPMLGRRFASAAAFRRNVLPRLTPAQIAAFLPALLDATLEPGAPKAVLWGDSVALSNMPEHTDPDLSPSRVVAANLDDWTAGLALAPHVALALDPDSGRMIPGPALAAAQPVFADVLHLGFFEPVGAIGLRQAPQPLPTPATTVPAGPTGAGGGFTDPGPVAAALPAPLTGTHRFTTSRTYEIALPPARTFADITEARLDAAEGARPYLRFRPGAGTLDVTFAAAAPTAGQRRTLTLDGLWLGLLAAAPVPEPALDPTDPPTPIVARLILDGDFDEVVLRHITLDPGGQRARDNPLQAFAIPLVRLEIEGQVGRLLIERSITGPIWETNADPALCNPGRIEISDSIVQSIVPGDTAIQTRLAEVQLIRSTVLGRVEVKELHATDTIIRGRTRVTDTQHGCFRYSATGRDGAVLPPQFEAFVPAGELPAHWFASTRFGNPDFAVLTPAAPDALAEGGENGAEMGVFNDRALGVALADLALQIRDLIPVGQTPQFILEDPTSPWEDQA